MRRGPLIGALACVIGLAGCGATTTTVITTVGASSSATSSASGAASATTASSVASRPAPPSAGTTRPAAGPGATVHRSAFATPSRNIDCLLLGGVARCDIQHHSWQVPRRPRTCPPVVDYGQGLLVGPRGRGALVCAGDTVFDPKNRPLPYGTTTQVGALSCSSETSGVTCTETRTHHGFFVSMQAFRVF